MRRALSIATIVCGTALGTLPIHGAVSKSDPAIQEQWLPYDQLDEQPRFPKSEHLWDKLQFPDFDALYHYPEVAIITIGIDAKGNVRTAELLKSTERDFGIEAVKAVKTWRIVPGRKGEKAVACITVVTLRAELTPKAGKYNVSRQAWLADPKNQRAK